MLRVRAAVGVAVVATPLLAGATVYAEEPQTSQVSHRRKVAELPIYGEPPMREFEFVPFEDTVVMKPPYDAITVCRQQVAGVVQGITARTDKVFGKLQRNIPQVTDFIQYVQADTSGIAKAAIISTAGLTGMALGYKGGLSRRIIFAGVGLTTAATVCYPNQAVEVGKIAWQKASTAHLHHFPPPDQEAEPKPEVDETPVRKATDATAKLNPDKVDHGMSKAEDKDMYTTRE